MYFLALVEVLAILVGLIWTSKHVPTLMLVPSCSIRQIHGSSSHCYRCVHRPYLTLYANASLADGGEEKRKLCLSLGADHWIDFTTCQDITAEIKRVTDGKGAHATVVTTASVRSSEVLSHIFTTLTFRSRVDMLRRLIISATTVV